MDLLARREHAPVALADKLCRRGYELEEVSEVLDALAHDGLLSAERYAAAVVAARGERGIGPVRIRAELAQVQIDEALIEQALTAAGVDWRERAIAACRKRFGDTAPEDARARAKRMRFLQQRGFEFDCIRAAVDGD